MATGTFIKSALLGAGMALVFSGGAMATSAVDIFAALTKPTGTALGTGPSYSIDAIKGNQKIRAEMPSIDIAGIRFASGKAELSEADMAGVADIAMALKEILSVRPFDVFLVEGHTDATGSGAPHAQISAGRAEAVAAALIGRFGIPAPAIAVAGYGEEFLLVKTKKSDARNRRVTIRRVTDLLDPLK